MGMTSVSVEVRISSLEERSRRRPRVDTMLVSVIPSNPGQGAFDRDGETIDFLLSANRDYAATRSFFKRANGLHGVPKTITIAKSRANTAAVRSIKVDSGADIEMRQSKYLNSIVEQDHRAVNRISAADARLQVIPIRASALRRRRDDTHDQEGANGLPRRPSLIRSIEVLHASFLSDTDSAQMLGPALLLRQSPRKPERAPRKA